MGKFPGFIGTMRDSDSPPSIPPHFVSFVWRYHGCATFRSFAEMAHPCEAGAFLYRSPPVISHGDDWASQVPGVPPVCMPRSMTPVRLPRKANTARPCCLPIIPRRRLPRYDSFEAQSRGLQTPCVRFTPRVTPTPRNTRFRLVANLCRAGLFTRRVLMKGFIAHSRYSPPPRLRLAQGMSGLLVSCHSSDVGCRDVARYVPTGGEPTSSTDIISVT